MLYESSKTHHPAVFTHGTQFMLKGELAPYSTLLGCLYGAHVTEQRLSKERFIHKLPYLRVLPSVKTRSVQWEVMPSILKARQEWGRRKVWKEISTTSWFIMNTFAPRDNSLVYAKVLPFRSCVPHWEGEHTTRCEIRVIDFIAPKVLCWNCCCLCLANKWDIHCGKTKKGDDLSRVHLEWPLLEYLGRWLISGWMRCPHQPSKLPEYEMQTACMTLAFVATAFVILNKQQSLCAGWFLSRYWWASAPGERHFAFAQAEANTFRAALVVKCLITLES